VSKFHPSWCLIAQESSFGKKRFEFFASFVDYQTYPVPVPNSSNILPDSSTIYLRSCFFKTCLAQPSFTILSVIC
jgi:hypothetical protein